MGILEKHHWHHFIWRFCVVLSNFKTQNSTKAYTVKFNIKHNWCKSNGKWAFLHKYFCWSVFILMQVADHNLITINQPAPSLIPNLNKSHLTQTKSYLFNSCACGRSHGRGKLFRVAGRWKNIDLYLYIFIHNSMVLRSRLCEKTKNVRTKMCRLWNFINSV